MKMHAYCNQQLALVLLELDYFKSIRIGVGFLAEAIFSFSTLAPVFLRVPHSFLPWGAVGGVK